MSSDSLRETVIRRVRLRNDLKPVKPYWLSGPPDPDWVLITHVTGHKGHATFDLQLLKEMVPAGDASSGRPRALRVAMAGSNSYDSLQIAKSQAHADLGIEYVEWEACHIEISNIDGSICWERALPAAEAGGAANRTSPSS